MAKVEIIDVDLQENSLDNSGDGELLGMVDEGSFGSGEDRSNLVSQSYLDSNEEENGDSYHISRELAGAVTYKFIQMSSDNMANSVTSSSPAGIQDGEFFLISNPVEVFSTTGAQRKPTPKGTIQSKVVTAKKRDDKRRATHNEVERRRRDRINTWITQLAALLPNSGLPDSASKGGILAKACDYITELTEKQNRLEKLEVDHNNLLVEIIRLNKEISELRKENTSMRNQLADNCIVLNHRPKTENFLDEKS